VTALMRLAQAVGRLRAAPPPPRCPACTEPMALRREEPAGSFAVLCVYACARCGGEQTRCRPWAIPD
jgi:hypothetical protein